VSTTQDQYITTAELAARWRMAIGSIRNMRTAGRGPKFVKIGHGWSAHVRYRLSDVLAYERGQG
jgi:hypothetical protein